MEHRDRFFIGLLFMITIAMGFVGILATVSSVNSFRSDIANLSSNVANLQRDMR